MKGVAIAQSVHVEAMPDDGLAEVTWVESLNGRTGCRVGAIVASCNLSDPNCAGILAALKAASPKVKGIRYILDYVGPFEGGKTATHVNALRHKCDYLRGEEKDAFARGFALLHPNGLSFDLQCAPAQLVAAAAMCSLHPETKVVIDHLGKPRHLGQAPERDEAELAVWREGMTALARLPNVYVKLSMLGYSVPGWHAEEKKEALLRSLVREVITLFGAHRCMFASNFHINAACSDSDGAHPSGPSVVELYDKYAAWVSDLSSQDRRFLFADSAKTFYGLQ